MPVASEFTPPVPPQNRRSIRGIVLGLLLIPLLAGVLFVVMWELPPPAVQLAHTVDGRLLSLSYQWQAGVQRDLQVWDRSRGRRLYWLDRFNRWARLSPRGRRLQLESADSKSLVIDLRDDRVGKTAEWPLSRLTRFRTTPSIYGEATFTAAGSRAVSATDTGVRVAELATGEHRLVDLPIPINVALVAVSDDGRWAAIAEPRGGVRLRDLATGREVPLSNARGLPSSLVFSPDNTTLVAHNGSLKIWDVATARQTADLNLRAIVRPPQLVFSHDGKKLAIFENSDIVVVDLEKTSTLAQHSNPNAYWHDVEFSPDGSTLYAAGDDQLLRRWDFAAGTPPRLVRVGVGWILAAVGVALCMAGWAVAWVRRPPSGGRFRPLADAALVWGIGMVALLLRMFATGSRYEVTRPVLQFGMACFAALLCLIVIWSVLGAARWSLRIPGVIGLTALVMAPMLLWREFDFFLWQAVLGVASQVVGLWLVLQIASMWSGRRVRWSGESLPGDGAFEPLGKAAGPQFPIRDLLVWVLVTAVTTTIVIRFRPANLSPAIWTFALIHGIGFAAVGAAACLVALSTRHVIWWIILFVGLSATMAVVARAFPGINLVAPNWTAAQPALAGLLVLATLLIFRYRGYRLSAGDD